MVGCRDNDCVNVGPLEKFPVVAESGRLCSRCLDGLGEVVLPYVADGANVLVGEFLRRPQQVVAPVPHADKAKPHAIISAQDALIAQRGQRRGAFLGKGSARGCVMRRVSMPIHAAHLVNLPGDSSPVIEPARGAKHNDESGPKRRAESNPCFITTG